MSSPGLPINAPMLLLSPPRNGVQPYVPQPPTPQPWTPAVPRFGAPDQTAASLLRSLADNAIPKPQPQQPLPDLSGPLATIGKGLFGEHPFDSNYVSVTPNQMTGMGGNMGYIGNLLHGGNLFGNWGSIF